MNSSSSISLASLCLALARRTTRDGASCANAEFRRWTRPPGRLRCSARRSAPTSRNAAGAEREAPPRRVARAPQAPTPRFAAHSRRPRRGGRPWCRPRPCRPARASAGRARAASTSMAARASRVGVVGVVDQRDCDRHAAASSAERPLDRRKPSSPRCTAIWRQPAASALAAAASQRCAGCARRPRAAPRSTPHRRACASAPPVVALPVGAAGASASPRWRSASGAAPGEVRATAARARHRRPGTRRSIGRQRRDDAAVSRATASTLAGELLVLALLVVHQRDRRRRDRRQLRDLAGWFMPSSTTPARCARAAQQRHRHADVVVQVAPRWRGGVAAPKACAGMAAIICVTVVLPLLPVTDDQRQRGTGAPGPPSANARRRCRPPASRARPRPGRVRPRRACTAVLPAAKSLASEARRAASTNRSPAAAARVAVHALDGESCRRRPPGATEQRRVRRAMQGRHAHARTSSAACAFVKSENGSHARRSPGSPRGPCRRQDHVSRRHRPRAWRRWPRGSSMTFTDLVVPLGQRGSAAGWPMRRPWRGLSLVSTTRSASCAGDRAHQRTAAVSRLPPQPNTPTAGRRAAWRRGAARSAPSRAHRANGRNRPPPRAGARRFDALHAPRHQLQHRTGRGRLGQRHAERASPDHGQQVGDCCIRRSARCAPARAPRPRPPRSPARHRRRRCARRAAARRAAAVRSGLGPRSCAASSSPWGRRG